MLSPLFPPWGAFNGLLGQAAGWFRSSPPPPEPEEDLRTCLRCGQPFVGPVECRAEDRSRWRILLRCGNCDCRREALATSEQVSRLECDVAADIVAIHRALDRLEQERFAAQADAFDTALTRDLIDASDVA